MDIYFINLFSDSFCVFGYQKMSEVCSYALKDINIFLRFIKLLDYILFHFIMLLSDCKVNLHIRIQILIISIKNWLLFIFCQIFICKIREYLRFLICSFLFCPIDVFYVYRYYMHISNILFQALLIVNKLFWFIVNYRVRYNILSNANCLKYSYMTNWLQFYH